MCVVVEKGLEPTSIPTPRAPGYLFLLYASARKPLHSCAPSTPLPYPAAVPQPDWMQRYMAAVRGALPSFPPDLLATTLWAVAELGQVGRGGDWLRIDVGGDRW